MSLLFKRVIKIKKHHTFSRWVDQPFNPAVRFDDKVYLYVGLFYIYLYSYVYGIDYNRVIIILLVSVTRYDDGGS